MLVSRTAAAVREYRPAMLVLAGGVAANSRLRMIMEEEMKKYTIEDLRTGMQDILKEEA